MIKNDFDKKKLKTCKIASKSKLLGLRPKTLPQPLNSLLNHSLVLTLGLSLLACHYRPVILDMSLMTSLLL